MNAVQCSACGAEATVEKGSYRFTESGLRNVVLEGIELIRCPECGNVDPVIPRLHGLMRVLAMAVVAKPSRLQGQDVRFLRKYLKMNGQTFAALIHVDKTTLSKWENDEHPIGPRSDRLIRAVAMALGAGLNENMESVVRSFSQINDRRRRTGIRMNPQKMSYAYA